MKSLIKNTIPLWTRLYLRYRKRHGYFPNIFSQKTFNEKIIHRMAFDRRPVLTEMADKEAVRFYVMRRLQKDILPIAYHITSMPETIPFDELPNQFVIKPTHGSGWVKIVRDKYKIDGEEIIGLCRYWLKQNYYNVAQEWAYKNIKPQIIVEELIDDGSGREPDDYKFFVFDGEVKFIQVDRGRFTDHRRTLFDRNWKKIPVKYEFEHITEDVPQPPNFHEMLKAAEKLGAEIDFVRADFYDTGKRIYFGELTTTPEDGMGRFTPSDFDRVAGNYWRLRK